MDTVPFELANQSTTRLVKQKILQQTATSLVTSLKSPVVWYSKKVLFMRWIYCIRLRKMRDMDLKGALCGTPNIVE